MSSELERLLELIHEAFDGVLLGEGVSLHETIVIDNYGDESERRTARAPDEKLDWRKLVDDPELLKVSGIGGLAFYDAEGLRFHLPAYLCMTMKRLDGLGCNSFVAEELLFTLTSISDSQLERLSILDDLQRAAIREVLLWWRSQWEPVREWMPARVSEFDRAIEVIWNSESSILDHPDQWPSDP